MGTTELKRPEGADVPLQPTTVKHETREGWLTAAVHDLYQVFFMDCGYEMPEKWAVSCGFPRGVAKAIGQCWDPKVSADGTTHMFICPSLGDDVVVVLQVLLHEMVHAAVGLECKHRGPFRKLAKEFGMAGKMTATYAEPESELWHKLRSAGERLGKYPHAPMQKTRARGKGGSGWIRLMSVNDETYTVTISPRTVEANGFPSDPWGDEMVVKA